MGRNGFHGHRVLLIDDDTDVVESCQALLAQQGLAVTTCTESARALPTLKEGTYDVVLLDIRMPGMDGSDLLPLIKKIHPDLPVIIVSAYGHEGGAGYYQTLGAFDVLLKPSSPDLLMDAIARAIDQRERIPMTLTTLSLRENRDQLYRKLILTALRKTGWNQVRAAELLGISRYCLMRWIKKLGVAY